MVYFSIMEELKHRLQVRNELKQHADNQTRLSAKNNGLKLSPTERTRFYKQNLTLKSDGSLTLKK